MTLEEQRKTSEEVTCRCCGWNGQDYELVEGCYNSFIGANDELLCPNCENLIE